MRCSQRHRQWLQDVLPPGTRTAVDGLILADAVAVEIRAVPRDINGADACFPAEPGDGGLNRFAVLRRWVSRPIDQRTPRAALGGDVAGSGFFVCEVVDGGTANNAAGDRGVGA